MHKRLSHCSFRFESGIASKRAVRMAPDRPDSGGPMTNAEHMKRVVEVFTSSDVLPAKMIRPSAPRFKMVDEYPRDAQGHILHPFLGRRLTPGEIAQQRAWDEKLPALYKMEHDVPPEQMPAKLELPQGKELYVFGGEHNAKGVVDKLSAQYPANKMNFYPGQTLDDLVTKAKALGDQVPKDKLQGATATIMVDPDIFFGDKDAKTLEASLKELCQILKGYGMQLTVSTAPPIADYYYKTGGPANFEEQKADWKKTEGARDKRSVFNEAVRKLYLGKQGVDKVLEADVGLSFYKESTRLHPDYRSNNAYLSDAGLDLAARIFASGINRANGAPAPAANGDAAAGLPAAPKVEAATAAPKVPSVVVGDSAEGVSATMPETVRARLERLVQIVKDLRAGKFDEKPAAQIALAKAEIQWVKEQGIEVSQIEQLERDLKAEMPKVLLTYAEAKVKVLTDSFVKPFAYEVHQAILAIEEAEKAGADKDKIAKLKLEVKKFV